MQAVYLGILFHASCVYGHSFLCKLCIWTFFFMQAVYLDILFMQAVYLCKLCIWAFFFMQAVYLDILFYASCVSGHSFSCKLCIWTFFSCKLCIWAFFFMQAVYLGILFYASCVSGHSFSCKLCIWTFFSCKLCIWAFFFMQAVYLGILFYASCVSGHSFSCKLCIWTFFFMQAVSGHSFLCKLSKLCFPVMLLHIFAFIIMALPEDHLMMFQLIEELYYIHVSPPWDKKQPLCLHSIPFLGKYICLGPLRTLLGLMFCQIPFFCLHLSCFMSPIYSDISSPYIAVLFC